MRTKFVLCSFLATALWSTAASAGKYDLDLTTLGTLNNGTVTPNYSAFRSLSSELGTVIAPKVVDPADSLGLSAFAVSADFSLNTISGSKDYWDNPTGGSATGTAPSMQIVGRKGLWPGLEVGAGATHLLGSRMWTVAGYAKVALNEGFKFFPSVALRGAFARLIGAKDLSLNTAAPGVEISHKWGLGHTANFTPYGGYEALLISSRSTVLDATPNCDEFASEFTPGCDDLRGANQPEFVFGRQSLIVRHRPFVGFRLVFSVIRLSAEAMLATSGSTSDTVDGENAADNSKLQQQYTVSLGLDF